MSLPISYYEVLRVHPETPTATIDLMLDSMLASPPQEGFTVSALTVRAEVLEAARDTLLDLELRAEYDEDLKAAAAEQQQGLGGVGRGGGEYGCEAAIMVDVPMSRVPGVLCLLQEAGRSADVAEAGLDLLSRPDGDPAFRADVALATALAYSDLSRDAMSADPPAVAQGCELLEAALKLLQDEGGPGLAPSLQAAIEDSLQEMGPTRLLELLALPLDKEHEEGRREGIQVGAWVRLVMDSRPGTPATAICSCFPSIGPTRVLELLALPLDKEHEEGRREGIQVGAWVRLVMDSRPGTPATTICSCFPSIGPTRVLELLALPLDKEHEEGRREGIQVGAWVRLVMDSRPGTPATAICSCFPSIGPTRVLELLALPLDKEHEEGRREGIQAMRDLSWFQNSDGSLSFFLPRWLLSPRVHAGGLSPPHHRRAHLITHFAATQSTCLPLPLPPSSSPFQAMRDLLWSQNPDGALSFSSQGGFSRHVFMREAFLRLTTSELIAHLSPTSSFPPLPLSPHQAMRDLLWSQGPDGALSFASQGGFSRHVFMREAFLRLTTSELIAHLSPTSSFPPLPLSPHQAMRDLLWSQGPDGALSFASQGGFSRHVFMREAFLRLTTSELIAHFAAAPPHVDAVILEAYWVALAFAGRGFFLRRPADIVQSDALLKELNESTAYRLLVSVSTGGGMAEAGGGAAAGTGGGGGLEEAGAGGGGGGAGEVIAGRAAGGAGGGAGAGGERVQGGAGSAMAMVAGTDVPADLSVERAMCALLLGQVGACKRWLGVHVTPPCGDLAVAEEVVAMRFRDTSHLSVVLSEYFDHPAVGSFLDAWDQAQGVGGGGGGKVGETGRGEGGGMRNTAMEVIRGVFPWMQGGGDAAGAAAAAAAAGAAAENPFIVSTSATTTTSSSSPSPPLPTDSLQDDSLQDPSTSLPPAELARSRTRRELFGPSPLLDPQGSPIPLRTAQPESLPTLGISGTEPGSSSGRGRFGGKVGMVVAGVVAAAVMAGGGFVAWRMRSGRFGPSLLGVEAAMVGQQGKEQATPVVVAGGGFMAWRMQSGGLGMEAAMVGQQGKEQAASGECISCLRQGGGRGGFMAWRMRSGRFGPSLLGVEAAMVGQQAKKQATSAVAAGGGSGAGQGAGGLCSLSLFCPPSFLSEVAAGAEEYSEVEEVQWAVRVVRHWQVKAAALGQSHPADHTHSLPLTFPTLSSSCCYCSLYTFRSNSRSRGIFRSGGGAVGGARSEALAGGEGGSARSATPGGDGSSEQVSEEGSGGSSGAGGSAVCGCSGPDSWPSHPRSLVPFLPSSLCALPQVEMAAVSKGEKKAVVEAVVQEAARLVDAADPTHNDAYRSTYTARYELLQTGTCWKIVGGTVLR
ncbi:unnamed protein product [Closterium sp. Naga37s-1]|nr:unnamed protein product [Closterium sp. Naga37s-1]